MIDIKEQLEQFALDEGKQSALKKCENFRDALDELLSITSKGSPEEKAVLILMEPVRKAILSILKMQDPR